MESKEIPWNSEIYSQDSSRAVASSMGLEWDIG
jgi:hypothetical protein